MQKEANKKIIFVIEDDKDISELMEIVLNGEGYEVKIFGNGKKIEPEIKKQKPRLILMDLWVPGLDGAAFAKKMKGKKGTSDISIILVSANNNLEKITKLCHADGFLSKPFDIKELVSVVKKFI